ncbi:TadE family type IV pilus minor pilin [Mycobacterium sp. WMMD1722]|uniref:TadE family type IV pilus minor pilin n=1 Tax=Mycobacterium sp. WMMD1722 TaxID=3404117 RepID=UPI003BF540EE
MLVCLAGLTAVGMQLRCLDAAREAARLAARGDDRSATDTARAIAPGGATVELRRDGTGVVARVSARSTLLPGITISGRSVAATEPGVR